MPFFTGSDKAFLAALPPSAMRYDWDRDRYCIKRGQRGYFTLTHGCGEHGSRLHQSWHWKTWVDYAGHRFSLHVYARREADAASGDSHLKCYEWRHAIRRDHPMRATLHKAMWDLDHFSGGFEPSVESVRATFLAHIKAAIDGGEEGYREFLNRARK
jgi:hypothetical protein